MLSFFISILSITWAVAVFTIQDAQAARGAKKRGPCHSSLVDSAGKDEEGGAHNPDGGPVRQRGHAAFWDVGDGSIDPTPGHEDFGSSRGNDGPDSTDYSGP